MGVQAKTAALTVSSLLVGSVLAGSAAKLGKGEASLETQVPDSWVCGKTGHVRWVSDVRVPKNSKVGLYLARVDKPAHLLNSRAFDYDDNSAAITLDCTEILDLEEDAAARLAVALGNPNDNEATVLAMTPPFTVAHAGVTSPTPDSVVTSEEPFNVTWISDTPAESVDVHLFGRTSNGAPILLNTVQRAQPDTGNAVISLAKNITDTFDSVFVRITTKQFAATSPDYTLLPSTIDADAVLLQRRRRNAQRRQIPYDGYTGEMVEMRGLLNPDLPIGGLMHAVSNLGRGVYSMGTTVVKGVLANGIRAGGGIGIGVATIGSGAGNGVNDLVSGRPVRAVSDVIGGTMRGVGVALLGVGGGVFGIVDAAGNTLSTALGVTRGTWDTFVRGITLGGRI